MILKLMLMVALATTQDANETLFLAAPLPAFGFTAGIEGPACDEKGNLFAVAFKQPENIGRVTPNGHAEVFVALPNGSCGNGIVFDREGMMYVADYVNHNILKIDPVTKKVSVFAHEPLMHQPNDLAIAADGTVYASDPDWENGVGQVWKVTPSGETTQFAAELGTANGVEVSPDGETLYVNESVQRNIWEIKLRDPTQQKRLVKSFPDHGLDGMRCDIDGNLYVARFGKGTVVKLSPSGEIMQEIDVLGAKPSNVCFGGVDGRTVYVTEMEKQRLVSFRVDQPGQAWARWQPH